jgi:alkylation response protein AidB-like acyl-CoA dehydrogenase
MQLEDHHRLFRDQLRDYLESNVEPVVDDLDEEPLSKDDALSFIRDLRELGIGYGEDTAEDYFGDLRYYAIGSEEISRVWPSLNVTLNMSFPALFAAWASEETRDALGDKLETGEVIGGLAVTEPGSGSHSMEPDTRARKDGDEYVIDGEKTWVSNATIADMVLVVAWDEEHDVQDMFVVDQAVSPFETRELDKLGWKGSPTGQLFFDDVRVPAENKLSNIISRQIREHGDITEALPFADPMMQLFMEQKPLNTMFSFMRTGMAFMAVGIMQAAYEDSLAYAKERETFGKPIAEHQLIQEHLYEMKAATESCRQLGHHTVDLLEDADPDSRMLSSLAKGKACEKSVEVTRRAVELHGANGLSADYPLERYYRDAQTMTIPDGTSEIMKLIVGKELTGHSAYA